MIWCQENIKKRWHNWVFSDECRFELYDIRGRKWAKTVLEVGVQKFGPSLVILGGISIKGNSKLIFVEGTENSDKYQKILAKAEPSLRAMHRLNFIFQQDGAPCHRSISISDWFRSSNWIVSSWPANSPDLNPIENLWALIKIKIRKIRHKTIDELKENIQKVWDDILTESAKSLIQSMTDRLQTCIELQGKK